MKYNFHPAALTEYSEAVQFYAQNNIELAQNFINAVEDAIFRLIESPKHSNSFKKDPRLVL